MGSNKKQYQFVNNQTGYVIAYLSVSLEIPADEVNKLLEKRRNELATEHGIYFGTIYWREERL